MYFQVLYSTINASDTHCLSDYTINVRDKRVRWDILFFSTTVKSRRIYRICSGVKYVIQCPGCTSKQQRTQQSRLVHNSSVLLSRRFNTANTRSCPAIGHDPESVLSNLHNLSLSHTLRLRAVLSSHFFLDFPSSSFSTIFLTKNPTWTTYTLELHAESIVTPVSLIFHCRNYHFRSCFHKARETKA